MQGYSKVWGLVQGQTAPALEQVPPLKLVQGLKLL